MFADCVGRYTERMLVITSLNDQVIRVKLINVKKGSSSGSVENESDPRVGSLGISGDPILERRDPSDPMEEDRYREK
ncbi:Serine/threonine protein kinase [Fusarium oxysporum f. sp. albedinis]|nr:Serine/threonine protein kinase [Fusarium oxysporum f. sp. albedinis]